MRLRITLVALFFALMFLHFGVHSYHDVSLALSPNSPGWALNPVNGRVQLVHNQSSADTSLLRDGDQVVAVNGREITTQLQLSLALDQEMARLPPESPYSIVVRREDQSLPFTLRTGRGTLLVRTKVVLFWLLFAIFPVTGLIVFWLKPNNKQALLLALILAMSWQWTRSPHELLTVLFARNPSWLIAVLLVALMVGRAFPAVFLHFFLVFPKSSPLLRRYPRFEYFLYFPYLVIAVADLVTAIVIATTPGVSFAAPAAKFSFWLKAGGISTALYLFAGLVSLVINYVRAERGDRDKLRVVLVGTLAGVLPPLLFVGSLVFFNPAYNSLFLSVQLALLLLVPLIPVSFAYAIVRHQVIPVGLIIRRGIQYLLAKNALRLLIALPIAGLMLTIFASRHRPLEEILFRNSLHFYLLAAAAVVVGAVFRKRLSAAIDRKFFREHYNQDQILRELIEDVRKADSVNELSRLVSQRVDEALHPEQMYLFYRELDHRDLSLGYSSGGTGEQLRIPQEFELLRFVEFQGRAIDFPFPQKTNLPETEKAWLAQLGTRLVVPMTGTDNRLAGLFLLGQKKSEVPYTASDCRLLETLADQIAVVYENVRLKEHVDRDRRIKHEVLARVEERQIILLKECPRCGACFDSSQEFCVHDRSELTLSLPVERTIEGRYRLDKLLGRGGMGAVYQAVDLRLSRDVAVKILGSSFFGDAQALRRFEVEAQTSARLIHPNIITVYDYGVLNTAGAYLVMELITGETLRSVIKRDGRVPAMRTADWLEQILTAVGAAHSAGVIHRDLKPDNIFIAGDERNQVVKILDFGLAKMTPLESSGSASPTAVRLTAPGAVMGTFGYMAPEQLMGGIVNERSDLFSLGVITVEMLTGQSPFLGKTYHEQLGAIIDQPFVHEGDQPERQALNIALQKSLAQQANDRFGSTREMQEQIVLAIRRYARTVESETPGLNDQATFFNDPPSN